MSIITKSLSLAVLAISMAGTNANANLNTQTVSAKSFSKQVFSQDEAYYLVPVSFESHLPKYRKILQQNLGDEWMLVRLNEYDVLTYKSNLHQSTFSCGGLLKLEDHIVNNKIALSDYIKSLRANRMQNDNWNAEVRFVEQGEELKSYLNAETYWQLMSEFTAFNDRYSRQNSGQVATNWIEQKAKAWAQTYERNIEVRQIDTGSGYVQKSLVIKIPGQDPSLPGVLVGGHIDTFANAKPGADDDASGSMATLEVFRAIISSGKSFKRDMYFAFYAAEEMGLIGSQRMVADFIQRNIRLEAVMQLDMIGFKSPNATAEIYLTLDYTSDSLNQFVRKLAKQYLNLSDSQIGGLRCDYACSDHASWYKKNFRTTFPFESSFDQYNPHIHTGRDALSLIDLKHAMKFVELAGVFMLELGEPL